MHANKLSFRPLPRLKSLPTTRNPPSRSLASDASQILSSTSPAFWCRFWPLNVARLLRLALLYVILIALHAQDLYRLHSSTDAVTLCRRLVCAQRHRMAPTDDLKAHANSSVDFYELLSIPATASDTEIRRAYRRTSLKYHPDKVGATEENLEKFHLLQVAQDVLSDPGIRALYDQSREARERRKREDALLEGRRRQMKEDLERRESGILSSGIKSAGIKRRWNEEEQDSGDRLEREIQRIAESNRRVMAQMKEEKERKRQREALEEEDRRDQETEKKRSEEAAESAKSAYGLGGSHVAEIERTIKVRWIRDGAGQGIDKAQLEDLFKTFGPVENVFLLKDKKQRSEGRKEKKIVATGVLVFASVVGAHAAVEDAHRQEGALWHLIDSVRWAEDKASDARRASQSPPSTPNVSSQPSAPASPLNSSRLFAGLNGSPNVSPGATYEAGIKKTPSFASFSTPKANTPGSSPSGKVQGPNSPSLEELTMMRLKNKQRDIERQKLAEQLRQADAAGPPNGE